MKKIIAIILTLCLLCGAVAFAEDGKITVNGGTSDTKVSYTIGTNESFTVTIPASLKLSLEYGQPAGDLKVALAAPNFNVAGKTISVALTNAAFKLVNGSNEIPYTIKDDGTAIDLNDVVLSWTSGGATTTAEKKLKINGTMTNGIAAGTYEDTLTFTVSVSGGVTVGGWENGGDLGGGEAVEVE